MTLSIILLNTLHDVRNLNVIISTRQPAIKLLLVTVIDNLHYYMPC